MLKSAVMFAVSALALAMLAPDIIAALQSGTVPAAPLPTAPRAAVHTPMIEPAAVRSQTAEHEVAVPADAMGQFSADARINGQSVRMLIDTGASFVVLSANSAERMGIAPPSNARRVQVHTANGDAQATLVKLNSVEIGPVYLPEVEALIADRSAGEVNLVGTSFLRRLAGVEQRNGELYLRQ